MYEKSSPATPVRVELHVEVNLVKTLNFSTTSVTIWLVLCMRVRECAFFIQGPTVPIVV